MKPFERFKKLNTEGNLWVYILSLGKEKEIQSDKVKSLVFEKYGFLPGTLLIKKVLYRLKREGYIKKEKFKGKAAFKTTRKGREETEKMKIFSRNLLKKI